MGQQEQPALVVPVVFFCPKLENNPIKREQSPACLAMQSDRVEGKGNYRIIFCEHESHKSHEYSDRKAVRIITK